MDWFENILTGAIYYNNKMGINDAGKGDMEGFGWRHFGPNEMFEEGRKNSDYMLALSYGEVRKDFSFNEKYESRNTFNMRIMLDGGGPAEKFMGNLGYSKKPLLADVLVTETHRSIAEVHQPFWLTDKSEFIERVYAWTYAKKDNPGTYNVTNIKDVVRSGNFWTSSWTEIRLETRLYDYSSYRAQMDSGIFLSLLDLAADIFSTYMENRK